MELAGCQILPPGQLLELGADPGEPGRSQDAGAPGQGVGRGGESGGIALGQGPAHGLEVSGALAEEALDHPFQDAFSGRFPEAREGRQPLLDAVGFDRGAAPRPDGALLEAQRSSSVATPARRAWRAASTRLPTPSLSRMWLT